VRCVALPVPPLRVFARCRCLLGATVSAIALLRLNLRCRLVPLRALRFVTHSFAYVCTIRCTFRFTPVARYVVYYLYVVLCVTIVGYDRFAVVTFVTHVTLGDFTLPLRCSTTVVALFSVGVARTRVTPRSPPRLLRVCRCTVLVPLRIAVRCLFTVTFVYSADLICVAILRCGATSIPFPGPRCVTARPALRFRCAIRYVYLFHIFYTTITARYVVHFTLFTVYLH